MFDPDICLCSGYGCDKKESCLRYKYHLRAEKEKNNYNTYFTESPICGDDCEFYIKSL